MRIMLVAGALPPTPCGVGDYTNRLAEALAADGQHQVALMTRASDALQSTATVHQVVGVKGWRLSDFRSVHSAINGFEADVVHLQMPSQGFRHSRLPDLIPAIAWLGGMAVVRTWHEPPGLRGLMPLAIQSVVPGRTIVVRKDFLRRIPPWLRAPLKQRCTFIPGASAIPRAELTEQKRNEVQQQFKTRDGRLIVFFGFIYPAKGAERVFDIADSKRDTIVFVGPADDNDPYTKMVLDRGRHGDWAGHARSIGSRPPDEVAILLAAADAVVLPFPAGGGSWNSSISAAVQQGTPVITTSAVRQYFDPVALVHYAEPNDIAGMRSALDELACRRRPPSLRYDRNEWHLVAQRHLQVYRRVLARRRAR